MRNEIPQNMSKIFMGLVLLIAVYGLTPKTISYTAPDKEVITNFDEGSWDKDRILSAIHYYAEEYNVSATQMIETIRCESNFNPNARSLHVYKSGNKWGLSGHEQSYGLSQIHLPSHPHITEQQALDPSFSIEFMAREFSNGNQGWWTCWRQLYS